MRRSYGTWIGFGVFLAVQVPVGLAPALAFYLCTGVGPWYAWVAAALALPAISCAFVCGVLGLMHLHRDTNETIASDKPQQEWLW